MPVSLRGREGSWEQKVFVDPDSLTVRNIVQYMQKQYFSLNGFVVADITLFVYSCNKHKLTPSTRKEGRRKEWQSVIQVSNCWCLG